MKTALCVIGLSLSTLVSGMVVDYNVFECTYGTAKLTDHLVENYKRRKQAVDEELPGARDPRLFTLLNELETGSKLFDEIVTSRTGATSANRGRPYEFNYLDFATLQLFANRPEILETFLLRTGNATPEILGGRLEGYQTWAKALLALDFVLAKRLEVSEWSQEDFKKLAALEGFQPEIYGELFRLDARPPTKILTQQGFHTRSLLTPIAIHSHRLSVGTSFISLTTAEANSALLKVDPVLNAAEPVLRPSNQKILQAVERYAAKGSVLILQTYEYRVKEALGVSPKENARVEKEKEIVSPQIQADQIVAYRVVEFAIDRAFAGGRESLRELIAYDFGPWQPMPSP